MFPMTFDHKYLDGLPLLDDQGTARTARILNLIITRRVIPYYKSRRGTDPIVAAKISDRLQIKRLEDQANDIRLISLATWETSTNLTIWIHERIFDYLAFVIPSDPQARLGEGPREERKMLAFAEFMLRHQMEHFLYPGSSERQVIRSDVQFAMRRRQTDPTFYQMLCDALSDEMIGFDGQPYLALFAAAQQGTAYETLITRMLIAFVSALKDVPLSLLKGIFLLLDMDLQNRLLGECYRRCRDSSYPLIRRTDFLQKVLNLFQLLLETDETSAKNIFTKFKTHWGLVSLFRELELPDINLETKDADEIFATFKTRLQELVGQHKDLSVTFGVRSVDSSPPRESLQPATPHVKSLKDRIEEAHQNPAFPPRVLEVIDRNKLNAVGHSGTKYSELIETLLAIPWGKLYPVEVSPQDFEKGLNQSHYGLQRPKEIISDFFTNLIWRYQQLPQEELRSLQQLGSAFLFVGPPGVGKTSLAISVARNLGIPYHKLSLGGMRDEADLRGHGFTYEGSKPGAIVQGLIKMGVMNGMFIMDEADKTEKFAIATLLEILDPEQNHLFHDKFTQSTVDIDLSNCHFILTANTLETVPPPVVNRCEVVVLDRYSVEEKVAIAQQHLIHRVRRRYQIDERRIRFDPDQEHELLKYLVKNYTYEAGVRELERVIRTLFLRVFRKEILGRNVESVVITRGKIKEYLETPPPPRQINPDDRIGEMLALGINVEFGIGAIIPIQATRIETSRTSAKGHPGFLSMVHATGNIQRIMDESRKVATTAIIHCAEQLGIASDQLESPIHLHFMGASSKKDGPSAGGAIALALASTLSRTTIRRDVAMTGEIDTQGRITGVGGLDVKLETAYDAGCKTMIIPKENLHGVDGIERLPNALKAELQILTYDQWAAQRGDFDYTRHILQIIAVEHIVEAAEIAFITKADLEALEVNLMSSAETTAKRLGEPSTTHHCIQAIYIKNMNELKPSGFDTETCSITDICYVMPPQLKKSIETKRPELKDRAVLFQFDPSRETLVDVLKRLATTICGQHESPCRLTITAPFFFLRQNRIHTSSVDLPKQFTKVMIFANNFTAQGVKIKSCKALLNRAFCHLSRLDPLELDSLPFLACKEGVYLVDLSFIPEKLRLDVERAERILNDNLRQWMQRVEDRLEGRNI